MNKNITKILILGLFVVIAIPSLAFGQGRCTVNGEEVPCPEVVQTMGRAAVGFGVFAIIVGILGIATTVFWIMMIVHAATKPIESKALWIILMVITGIIGALVYYFAVKRTFQAPPTAPQMPQM